MLQRRHAVFLSPLLIATVCIASLFSVPVTKGAFEDEGVRAELPQNNSLRIENRRGGVEVEVWTERYVAVAATIAGATPKRSPVIIQRTEQLLSVGVVRATATTSGRVDLSVRIPEDSRVTILTTDGKITVRGLPAALTALDQSGAIRVELPDLLDADVSATSVAGVVNSSLATTARTRSGKGFFHTVAGAGTRVARINSERGRITLAPLAGQLASSETAPSVQTVRPSVQIQSSSSERQPSSTRVERTPAPSDSQTPSTQTESQSQSRQQQPPQLIGASATPGAGTPATNSNEPQDVDEGDVIRVDTQLVTVNMSVIDRGTNRGLTGLTQNDFKIYENSVQQQIVNFESASAPFNMLLLIDLSGSTREVVQLIRAAAQHFVDAARPADRIGIITFASAPVIVSRLTTDRAALSQSINSIEQPQGSTKLYDSLAFTLDEVLKDAKDSRRNAIVLMSDGLDSTLPNVAGDGSALDYNELLNRVREFDGVLYTLWLNTEYDSISEQDVQPETFDLAYDRMKELADAGGGLFYEVENLEDLAGAYERVVADLGTVYSIGYRPTNKERDGKWRAIRVAIARPNAVARGKRGYYAK